MGNPARALSRLRQAERRKPRRTPAITTEETRYFTKHGYRAEDLLSLPAGTVVEVAEDLDLEELSEEERDDLRRTRDALSRRSGLHVICYFPDLEDFRTIAKNRTKVRNGNV